MHPLQQAAKIIEAYRATLDITTSVCACCGVTKYENFTEYNHHKELGGVLAKLERFAQPNRR